MLRGALTAWTINQGIAFIPSTMSQLVPTNIRAEDLIMDIRGGGRDHRYYCLPPFRGGDSEEKTGRGFPFYLVSQGHVVGVFDNW
jgi:hypothetical protein